MATQRITDRGLVYSLLLIAVLLVLGGFALDVDPQYASGAIPLYALAISFAFGSFAAALVAIVDRMLLALFHPSSYPEPR